MRLLLRIIAITIIVAVTIAIATAIGASLPSNGPAPCAFAYEHP